MAPYYIGISTKQRKLYHFLFEIILYYGENFGKIMQFRNNRDQNRNHMFYATPYLDIGYALDRYGINYNRFLHKYRFRKLFPYSFISYEKCKVKRNS